ncbi:MAG TPA: hypothetical protein VFZ17_11990 [Acidimicrobiia bacterium]|nr:hypothetical protein [Acidimicrobiia bacterium]
MLSAPAGAVTRSPASVVARALATDASMTPAAQRVYLAARPTVDDRATFADHCPVFEAPDTVVLGCFVPNRDRIHVLRIDRPELASGMAVTAAHEMLHAVYARLPREERRTVDAMTAKFYASSSGASLRDALTDYPPRERAGERHSRLGTEVAHLPPKLERYYGKYFRHRAVVVAASAAYEHVFDDLESQLTALDAEITTLQSEVDELGDQADAAGAEAQRLADEIDHLRADGRIAASNDLVDPQNRAVETANALVDQHNALVSEANARIDAYNALVLTNQQLIDSVKPLGSTR